MPTPEVPIPLQGSSPKDGSIKVIRRIQKFLSSSSSQLRGINQEIAGWFNLSTQWLLGVEISALIFFGFTMIQVDEYAVAVSCWVILAVIWVSKAFDWDGV